eukprot:8693033-Prorocentrum_lima.AAC.1
MKQLHPRDMSCWWTGSTCFIIEGVSSQALTVDGLFDNRIQRALMNDPGEPYDVWDSGASHLSIVQASKSVI